MGLRREHAALVGSNRDLSTRISTTAKALSGLTYANGYRARSHHIIRATPRCAVHNVRSQACAGRVSPVADCKISSCLQTIAPLFLRRVNAQTRVLDSGKRG